MPVCVRRVCVDLMRLGVQLFVGLLCLLQGCIAVEFGFVRSALLLAVVLCRVYGCFVDCCLVSWALLGLLCFLLITHVAAGSLNLLYALCYVQKTLPDIHVVPREHDQLVYVALSSALVASWSQRVSTAAAGRVRRQFQGDSGCGHRRVCSIGR